MGGGIVISWREIAVLGNIIKSSAMLRVVGRSIEDRVFLNISPPRILVPWATPKVKVWPLRSRWTFTWEI